MEILVTGGAGFIGRHLVGALLKDGHRVVVIDNLFRGKKEKLAEFKSNPHLSVVYDSITDLSALERVFKNRFDAVLHLASSCDVQLSIDNPSEAFKTDLEGTFNLLEQTRAHSPHAKFIFLSTCMVYDRAQGPLTESGKLRASSPYAAAKLGSEFLVMGHHNAYGMKTTILRPFNTYGPFGFMPLDKGEAGVVLRFIRRKAQGKSLQVFGEGTQTRDLLYVSDCVSFILAALASDASVGKIIHAGSGKDIAINDLAALVSGGVVPIEHVAHHHPQSEVARLIADNTLAEQLLGWAPQVGLEDGIKMTEDWLMQHPEIVEEGK